MEDPNIILYQLNNYKSVIDRALQITEDYVSKHQLILTGGMAIDLALRQQGLSIYDDDTLPDYDIISDNNLHHANTLAELLCHNNFPDINVINAAHITTVKVRMRNIVLLDATYIPTECFKQIPYLNVSHLRVVHPHYQFIDQRLSLSHLLADTGKSLNVFNRLSKDMKRNNILRKAYPIVPNPSVNIEMKLVQIPLDLINVDIQKYQNIEDIAFVYQGSGCISGYVGYALMLKKKYILTDKYLEIEIPKSCLIRILSCDFDTLDMYLNNPKTYLKLLNLKPASKRCGDFEYVDTFGSRISCNILTLNKDIKVCVASVDYLLMEMLRDRIYVSTEPYTFLYHTLVSIVSEKRSTNESDNMWWPSLNCYGFVDLPESKAYSLEILMSPDIGKTLKPKNSYLKPTTCLTRSGFSPSTSHYFHMDGSENNSLVHTNYAYVLDEFSEFVQKKEE